MLDILTVALASKDTCFENAYFNHGMKLQKQTGKLTSIVYSAHLDFIRTAWTWPRTRAWSLTLTSTTCNITDTPCIPRWPTCCFRETYLKAIRTFYMQYEQYETDFKYDIILVHSGGLFLYYNLTPLCAISRNQIRI